MFPQEEKIVHKQRTWVNPDLQQALHKFWIASGAAYYVQQLKVHDQKIELMDCVVVVDTADCNKRFAEAFGVST